MNKLRYSRERSHTAHIVCQEPSSLLLGPFLYPLSWSPQRLSSFHHSLLLFCLFPYSTFNGSIFLFKMRQTAVVAYRLDSPFRIWDLWFQVLLCPTLHLSPSPPQMPRFCLPSLACSSLLCLHLECPTGSSCQLLHILQFFRFPQQPPYYSQPCLGSHFLELLP